jgi:transposase-like protein
MARYTKGFKESIIQKILLNPDRSAVSYARDASIPVSTVSNWVRNYKKKNGEAVGSKKQGRQWAAEQKFEALLQTAPMSEAEKSEYCRKNGIFPEQLEE